MQNIYWAIALFCGIIGGVAFGYQLRKIWAFKRKDTIEAKIENLILGYTGGLGRYATTRL